MRPTRTAAAALTGATLLLALAAPAALAKDGDRASVSPAQAAPGQSVTVTVSCEKSTTKTITAESSAFEGGPVTLTLGSDGRHTGSAKLANKPGGDAKVDGKCPDGATFSTTVTVTTVTTTTPTHAASQAVTDWVTSEAGHGGLVEEPHGAVSTGLGGSVGSNPAELAGGAVLVAGGVGGFLLLRRRSASDSV
ncbi:hypothetical protein OG689_09440 [Kitasatospora sp. NBC_00240]|uniref:hypothetical protein n=1 Tax=Kitasatospora sp. NBC_00240 TaxID=2903567 RepID=UPI002257623B|nr:hypothetical protein [Kitasatospora sp. NBC_00240]MCX5209504.1 hypothetical protein [Kitasatospora sp. NBC_00240]